MKPTRIGVLTSGAVEVADALELALAPLLLDFVLTPLDEAELPVEPVPLLAEPDPVDVPPADEVCPEPVIDDPDGTDPAPEVLPAPVALGTPNDDCP
jgi:hypothetical protein